MTWRRLEFLTMVLVSLVVAHNVVFLLAYGPGADDALAHTGHGEEWQMAVAIVLFAGACLLGITLWRLRQLGLLTRNLEAHGHGLIPRSSPFGHDLINLWARLSSVTALALVVQENIEHLQANLPLPGLTVLGSSEYPDALLVIVGIALAVALVASLIRWRHAVLIARLAAAIVRLRLRPEGRPRRPTGPDLRPGAILGRSLAVRGPPVLPVA